MLYNSVGMRNFKHFKIRYFFIELVGLLVEPAEKKALFNINFVKK